MSCLLPARVSQDAFDEVVKENMEDFELSPTDAVADAIKQFSSQGVCLDNLDLSVPSDESRAERSTFTYACDSLDAAVAPDGTVDLSVVSGGSSALLESLKTVAELCSPSHPKSTMYRSLLSTNAGIYSLMSLLGVTGPGAVSVLAGLLTALRVITVASPELRDQFVAQDRLIKLLEVHMSDASLVGPLLALAKSSCKACEANKGYFSKAGGCAIVVSSMKSFKTDPFVLDFACQLAASLCKFDDFRKEMSCAHDNARELHGLGIVPLLLDATKLAVSTKNGTLASASISAIRVLAVTDDVVQTLVAAGTLQVVKEALDLCESDEKVVASAIGAYRNVSANDQIKSMLCTDGSLDRMLRCMRLHYDSALIAEHGCGTVAAMALRKPENVTHIMACDGANVVLTAMKRHPKAVLVQRQGCLAVRNMVARNPEIHEAMMELGVEKALKDAGQFQGAVDEAYAALRDLGCEAGIVKFDETGNQIKTQVFGETKAKFNATFMESCDIEQRVDENARPANQSVRF